jgi:Tfp pilus assembly protein PilN
MRAVNLVPADARTAGGISAGRSGGAVYALLGMLVVLVGLVALWATTSGKIGDQKAELARIQQDVAQMQARAGALQSPGAVQQERMSRTATVKALASSRIDWAERLDAISRTLPSDVTLEGLDAQAAAAATDPTVAAGPAGATVNLNGCAPSQRAVARLMPRLRSMPDVASVTLGSSSTDTGSGQALDAQTEDSCHGATFTMALTYEADATAIAPAAGTTPPADGAAAPPTATTAVEGTPDTGTGGTQ